MSILNTGNIDTALVHTLFESAAEMHADKVAIVFSDETITYKQLNEQAQNLAFTIVGKADTCDLIGVSASRGIQTIIAVLAILKAGKAYLPLDIDYPRERLLHVIEDARLKFCIAPPAETKLFESLGVYVIETDSDSKKAILEQKAVPGSVAYVLYTSGSTGKPKGVCMGHKALVNLLKWQGESSSSGVNTRTLQFAPLSFDVSFQEIFATLTTGGTLVLIENELRIEPEALLQFIEKEKINRIFLPFVALQYLTEAANASNLFPVCLEEVITAGEQLKITPAIERFFSQLPICRLINQYGPTECHVVTECKLTGIPTAWPKLPSIGKAIANTEILILDANHNELPHDETGELAISGASLANGYLNNPELTASKFVEVERANGEFKRVYLTGDLARKLEDGNIEYLGRKDDQVKIRGVRIELGEIEVVLNQISNVKQAVVIADEGEDDQKRLVAYLVSGDGKRDTANVKQYLSDQLPDYMIPSAFVWVQELPKTTSGKIDKKALPRPTITRPDLAVLYKAPKTIIEKRIVEVWTKVLGIDQPGVDDNFFELGGNSLLALKSVTILCEKFGYTLPVTKLYKFATAAAIADFLENGIGSKNVQTSIKLKQEIVDDIAIIGMAVRLPSINTISEFWEILKEGRETTTFFTNEELSIHIDPSIKSHSNYVKARGVIDKIEEFDAAFFGINPKAAALMDPQQRVFLEITWEVLEQTGHLPEKYKETIGVYAGGGNNSYYINNVLPNPDVVDKVGAFNVMTLNEKDYIASRTAYELNLKGPAVGVYSACSTSLLAVAQAVDAVRKGYCSIAIAGAASITSPVKSGHLYEEGGILSKDGHCRPFDKDASGTVFSDGAGVVLLKSLKDAVRDGDTIYSIIKGVGVNNDGSGKGSFTAPAAEGQAGAISMAINDARLQPSDISFIEAHGTATAIGDPIEIEGLNLVFGQQQSKQFCAVGSVKSNVGHLTAASGIAGLIKTTLSLYHKQITPTLFYKQANPEIDFVNSPFYVSTELKAWATSEKRRAGVSSFGVGGTNVHVVVEEYENKEMESGGSRQMQLLTWSAKSPLSGKGYAEKLVEFLQHNKNENLADLAYSQHSTRAEFNHRYSTVVSTNEKDIAVLQRAIQSAETNTVFEKPSEVVFMFPGQGSQYLNMGLGLYQNEPVYKQSIDTCAELLLPYLKIDIRHIIFPTENSSDNASALNNTFYTQPAIFITEYALAKLWMSWGIHPTILCGHSIGEIVAAHLAGIFSLEDAIQFIVLRSKMVSELPKGKMLSIRTDVKSLKDILPQNLSIAAINSDDVIVVAGTEKDIVDFSDSLTTKEIPNKVLTTSHAFHSSMMEPIIDKLQKVAEGLVLHRPLKPIMSTVTGTWLTDAQAVDPKYWAEHVRRTVCFGDALKNILLEENPIFLEVGPGIVTTTLARKQTVGKKITVVSSLQDKNNEYASLLQSLGKLWMYGLEPDWQLFYSNEKRKRLTLPTYAFDKKYCWIDPPIKSGVPAKVAVETNYDKIPTPTLLQELPMRKATLVKKIKQIIEDASGLEMEDDTTGISFLEAGLDSLLLTQLAITLKKEFAVPVTFRQLQEESNTIDLLAEYLEKALPPDTSAEHKNHTTEPALNHFVSANGSHHSTLEFITQQLQLLTKQVENLRGTSNNFQANFSKSKEVSLSEIGSSHDTSGLSAEEFFEIKKPFGATPKIERRKTDFTPAQERFLQQLTLRYNKKTQGSKTYTQENRAHMADPRVVSGFSPLTKEVVYPIIVNKSKGSRLWDVDGNEYVDALNGFGSNLFGYQPDFLKKAIYDQVEKGFELGPQHELAGEVSKMICAFTNFDRAAFCNTGSEAVLGALRIARTVTGRSLVVAFTGSYHGINDEVLIRGTKKLKSFPAAPGIMPEAVQNMLILDYGTEESLQIIRERAHELAAVLVEPVQSRRPEFRPVDFLKQVRDITHQSNTVLIFDEVITGFRMHAGGAQALFDIKADVGTYGKVIGGGLPIGVIAGKKTFMDALDGGYWDYEDDSIPEVGVTYFAGTFVRHPLALATAKATLEYMMAKGPKLQESINYKAEYLANKINAQLERRKLPIYIAQFGSLWKTKFKEDVLHGELLFTLMREKGVHIWDGFPCFMTEAHSPADIEFIIDAFIESVDSMIAAGFYKEAKSVDQKTFRNGDNSFNTTPVPGARLGRDKSGNPAWFIADAKDPGKYLQIKTH
ncbi:polyketide synthase [Segetibacter aerophilus]|uniref:Amino acid adenylation domain-containing protein n=1 Tax=Segetibacter aerophilus TaxID=670293 RepID=A0A512BFP5_9BACT|nr:polyketide synthase [Segetibacter aerophilus]GEO10786.1 hypothetical protein SAE01_32820 [Segetibacter aerophilus]